MKENIFLHENNFFFRENNSVLTFFRGYKELI